jgi:hypothetical protein
MLRRIVLALMGMALFSGSLLAEEFRGTIRKLEKNTITLRVGDQDRTFEVASTTPVYGTVNVTVRRRRVQQQQQQVGQGVEALQRGDLVTVTTERRDGVETVTQIRTDNNYSSGGGGRRRLLRR